MGLVELVFDWRIFLVLGDYHFAIKFCAFFVGGKGDGGSITAKTWVT